MAYVPNLIDFGLGLVLLWAFLWLFSPLSKSGKSKADEPATPAAQPRKPGMLDEVDPQIRTGLPSSVESGHGQRLPLPDFLKGAAIFAVLAIHAADFAPSIAPIAKDALAFAVPLFIVVSGYLLTRRYKDSVPLYPYFRSAFWRVVLPYFLFTLILRLYKGLDLNPADVVLDLLFGRQNGGNLYFLPVIIQFYLLFPLIAPFRRLLTSNLALTAALLISMAFQIYYVGTTNNAAWNSDPVALVFFGRFLFFFLLGARLAHSENYFAWEPMPIRLAGALGLLIVFAALVAGINAVQMSYIFFTPILVWPMLAIVLDLILLLRLGLIDWTIRLIGRHSMAVYLLHTPILYDFLVPNHIGTDLGDLATFVALTLLTAVISLVPVLIVEMFLNSGKEYAGRGGEE